MAVDGASNVYVSGDTQGWLPGSPDVFAGNADVFVASWDGVGSSRWVRQLGRAGIDIAEGVAVDGAGNVYVTGYTDGTLPGSPVSNAGEDDVFVASWDSNGASRWVRQLGSAGEDHAYGLAVDGAGNVYVTGGTDGTLPGSPVPNAGLFDGFVASWDSSGVSRWVRHLGTALQDSGADVATDGVGNVYVTGGTGAVLPGSPDPHVGYGDVFVASLDSAGATRWVRQLGSADGDTARSVAVAGSGNIYVTGQTEGILAGPADPGTADGFVASWDTAGASRWVRQFGDPSLHVEVPRSVAVDGAGNVYVNGYTQGTLAGSAEPSAGGYDIFLASWDSAGASRWVYQLGSSGHNNGMGVAIDGAEHIYVGGATFGTLPGSADTNAGDEDVFVARWGSGSPPTNMAPTASIDSVSPSSGVAPLAVSFSGSGADTDGTVVGYSWDFGDGSPADTSGPSVSHTYTTPGTYTVTLTVTDDDGATGISSPVTVTVTGAADTVAFTITGGISYANSQVVSSGDISISRDIQGVVAATGSATFTSSVSGTAQVFVDVRRFWILPIYVGSLRLSDPGAGISLNHVVFFSRVNAVGTTGATNSQGWFDLGRIPWRNYTMTWTLHDLA